MTLVDGHGQAAPPVVASPTASERQTGFGHSLACLPDKNRVLHPGPLNVGSMGEWRALATHLQTDS